MRIAMICQYYYPEPFRVHHVCEALARRGHQVTVLTGIPNYPMGIVPEEYRHGQKRDEVINNVHVIRVKQIPRKSGKAGMALNYISFMFSACFKALTMHKEFDVIFAYQLSPILMAIPAILIKKMINKRLYLYCLDLWPESLAAMGVGSSSFLYKVMYRISRWCYQQADHIAYTSLSFKKYFDNVLHLKDRKYSYIPQFAESVFEDVESIEHEGINLMFAGNIGEMQSVETIIQAAALLRTYKVKWHIIGDGSALERCKQLADHLNVRNQVTFYGRLSIDKLSEFFSIADAMLVTLKDNEAISYTLPGKVQSYMAAGRPIIAAANGEVARVISDSQCGFYCAAEDASGLAIAVEQFIDCPDRDELGKNARKYYNKYFTHNHHFDAIINELWTLN